MNACKYTYLTLRSLNVCSEEKKKANNRRLIAGAKRYALIGLATIGGGALIGVTGGLVAPLIGTSLINLLGASAVLSAISGAVGATVVGSLFGVAGGGLTGTSCSCEEIRLYSLRVLYSSL